MPGRAESIPQSRDTETAAMTWAAAATLVVFVASRCLVPMDETDLFYNLRLGEIILQTRHVPRTNLLSFTNPDFPDPNLAWLFQIVLALAHRAAGIPGTVLLETGFVVLTFAVLFAVALRRGARPTVTAAVLALAAWSAEPRFVERPHLVTFLGLAVLLLCLERAEAGRPRLLWSMIPAGLIWANGNSCFFLAPATLFLYSVGARLDGRSQQARRALLVGGLMLPLLFATPSGAGWVGYVINHFRMPSLRPLQEYRDAQWPLDGPFFLLLGATLACLPGALARDGYLRRALPVLALGALGARRIRFVAEFSLLAGPFVSARISEHVAHGRAYLLRGRRGRGGLPARLGGAVGTLLRLAFARMSTRTRSGLASAAQLVVLGALGAVALGPRLAAAVAREPWLDLSVEEGLVPEAAIGWLNAHGLRDHLYNDLEVGSYLAWEGWPRHRVFQDPRINAYPEAWHAELRRPDLPRPRWEALLDRFGVEAALVTFPAVNPRAALFDPRRWALVYRSADALVFVRRIAAHRGLIELEELPLTFTYQAEASAPPARLGLPPPSPLRAASPEPPSPGVVAVVLEAPPADADGPVAAPRVWAGRLGEHAVEELDTGAAARAFERALTRDASSGALPPELADRFRSEAGALALRLGDPARAVTLLEGLTDPVSLTNRGFALVQQRTDPPATRANLELALALFRAALARATDDPEAAFGEALSLARLGRSSEAVATLGAFLDRWPSHLAAPQARRLLLRARAATATSGR
jgi:hypothetical protein